jgi:hypothetical protein
MILLPFTIKDVASSPYVWNIYPPFSKRGEGIKKESANLQATGLAHYWR